MSHPNPQRPQPSGPAADRGASPPQPAAGARPPAPVARVVAPPEAAAPAPLPAIVAGPRPSRVGSQPKRSLWREPKSIAAIGGGVTLLVAVGMWFAFFDGDGGTKSDPTADGSRATGPVDPQSIPIPRPLTGEIQVFTTPAGFAVLVEGEPVRDPVDRSRLLRTPCAITVPRGLRSITIAKEGYFDASESVSVQEQAATVRLKPTADAAGDAAGVLHGRFFTAEVGKPLPLATLNTPGREFDPFVTSDGLAIWFAADRAEGGGIYSASRSNPFEDFGPPQLAELSAGKGPDLPGSPSVSGDGQLVAFCVPRKARIRGLSRSPAAVLGDFDRQVDIRHSDSLDAYWPAAQLLADGDTGRLKVYWTEIDKGTTQSFVATRPDPLSTFGNLTKLSLPGGKPCLSADGLRQHAFDGKLLQRARRTSTNLPFSALETVREIDLPDYKPNPEYRQYFVSFDEQWLFYCPDPEAHADLYVARLSDGPGWGFVASGRPIEDLPVVAQQRDPFAGATTFELPDRPRQGEQPAPKKIDPRTIPLPYTAHWKEFAQLLADRKYDEAGRRLDEREKAPEFAADRNLLAWDRELLEGIRGFWNDVRAGVASLKPGDEYSQSGVKLAFVGFENDVLTGKFQEKEIVKSIFELRPGDLLAFADRVIAKDDAAGQRRMGLFLAHDAQALPQQAKVRFDRAGDAQTEHAERLAARLLQQAEREIARENASVALALIGKLREQHPESEAAKTSRQVEDGLYETGKWENYGTRQWQRGPLGEFTAAPQRVANSYLMWPEEFERFELRMEWKVADVSTAFGGVYFRWNILNGQPFEPNTSFKIQLGNDYGIAPDPTVSGGLFQIEAPRENAVKPAGQWNDFRLRVNGDKVDVWINGKHVLDTVTRNAQLPAKGIVLLDGISGGISYRKILLVEPTDPLDPARPPR
ncbi:MAG: family 16 glycoside hydrolase [Planctomycetales bacterium]